MTKNIGFLSDIHIDSWVSTLDPKSKKFNKQLNDFFKLINFTPKFIDDNNIETMIIAGDIGHYNAQIKGVLLEFKKLVKNLIITFGNHEMYLLSNQMQEQFKRESINRLKDLEDFCIDNDIIFLNGQSVEIDSIKIMGTGMYWDGSVGKKIEPEISEYTTIRRWLDYMNDGLFIHQDGKRNYKTLPCYGTRYEVISNFQPLEFFKKEYSKLFKYNKEDKIDIIVTHYPPIMDNEENLHHYDNYYCFDGTGVIDELQPKYWIHGHIHTPMNIMYNGCNILSNPIGYKSEYKKGTNREIKILYLKDTNE